MNTELKLHYFQKTLLKKLTLASGSQRFNDLLIDGLESEHMNYHLQKLIEIGLVEKNDIGYVLSVEGKDYTNLMDDQIETIEKLPKTSMILVVVRINAEGKEEYLLNKRLRQPYYGKVGFLTGKPHFGETFREAVLRELYEESGLTAKEVKLVNIYHKIRKTKEGNVVQDVIFYRHLVTEISGSLIEKTPLQENFWATADEISNIEERYDTFVVKTIKEYNQMELTYTEDVGEPKDF